MSEQASATTTCRYPGCENSPEPPSGPGRRPQYCPDPAHTPVTAWRERKRHADAEHGTTTSEAETSQPVTMARLTGAELLRQMRDLAGTLAVTAERLTGTVETMTDPTAAEAEVEATRAAAEQRAAAAEAQRAQAERRAVIADQMRAAADEAAEDMSRRLAAEQDRARQAHHQLEQATAAYATEIEQIRSEAGERITTAQTQRDTAVQAASAARDAAVAEARRCGQEARQAEQRATTAEARAQAATAETSRARHDAVRELDQFRASAAAELERHRADAARERDELRELFQDRVQTLTEARDAQQRRAERAEQDLDTARAELVQLRQYTQTLDAPIPPKRRRASRPPEK